MDKWQNSSEVSRSRDPNEVTPQFQKSVNVTKDELWVDHRDEEKIYFTDIWENDEPKVCKVNNATNLVCSKLSLSETCADSNAINCRGNQCRIKNHIYGPKSFWVTCDGDWTIIQRRMDGSVDFERNWQSYKEGFGDLDGEFWLGLEKIHSLTALYGGTELMIEMQDFDNVWRQAYYESFRVGNEATTYLLEVKGSIKSTAGDSFSIHSGKTFSTRDRDTDKTSSKNCAASLRGAWWYYMCDVSHNISNLNGFYYNLSVVPAEKPASGIVWKTFRGARYSLKFVQMKIRPKKL
uniref:Fibrinogen n=1 Tax=Musca domestica TaxID=7370 RepID=T1P8R6_MUSDO